MTLVLASAAMLAPASAFFAAPALRPVNVIFIFVKVRVLCRPWLPGQNAYLPCTRVAAALWTRS